MYVCCFTVSFNNNHVCDIYITTNESCLDLRRLVGCGVRIALMLSILETGK